jgi:alkanesulfonate monooxygenase SsuD/methylene tetrahydromethanopterin reductase-like flavin-dependent oxidoreductase (luciferase family)
VWRKLKNYAVKASAWLGEWGGRTGFGGWDDRRKEGNVGEVTFGAGVGFGMPGERPPTQIMRDALELAELLEEVGFDQTGFAEHHFSDYVGVPSPAIAGAAIAARTEKLRIGIGISVLPLHNPVTVAEEYAMLDVLSNGRLEFGAGRGYQAGEFKGHNIPLSESRDRFDEALQIIEGLWTTKGEFSYAGEYYNVDEIELFPQPVQDPIPIRVAAVSPDSFERLARQRRKILCAPSITPLEKIKASFDTYWSVLKEEGEDPDDWKIPFPVSVYIGDTREEAYEGPRVPMEWFQRRNSQLMTKGLKPTDPNYSFYTKAQANRSKFDYAHYFDRVENWVFDTTDNAIRRLQYLAEHMGPNCPLQIGSPNLATKEQSVTNIRRIAERIMPCYRG